MPVKWVQVKHSEHGWETSVPESAVELYRDAGWKPVNETSGEAKPAAKESEPATGSDTAKTASGSDAGRLASQEQPAQGDSTKTQDTTAATRPASG